MTLVLPSIGSLIFDATTFISAHPALIYELAGHSILHSLYSHSRSNGRRKGKNRRQSRKLTNRKRRRFVDNIIMHHKRLHDRNRAMLINNARDRALIRKNTLKKDSISLQQSVNLTQEEKPKKWTEKTNLREKGREIRGRIDARRLRARSRWISVVS